MEPGNSQSASDEHPLEVLPEDAKQLQRMLDQLNVGIAKVDENAKFTQVNGQFCRIIGYTESELLSMTMLDITHPADLPQNLPMFQRCVTEGMDFVIEKRYIHKKGTEVWVSASVSRVIESNDKTSITAVVIDITDKKLAEQRLTSSEERYQNFIKRSTEGIWRFEAAQPILVTLPPDEQIAYFFEHAFLAECNDAMAKMYGFTSAEELVGARVRQLFPDDENTKNYFRAFIASGYALNNAESRELDKDGNAKYFSNNLLGIVENGMLYRCWGTQRDITESKLAQEILLEREARFTTLADTLPQMVWLSDTNGNNEYYSKQWKIYCGVDNPHEAWDYMIHPDDRAKSDMEFAEMLSSGLAHSFEVRLRNKAGIYRWHLSVAEPVKNAAGDTVKWVGAITDIHERKMAAEHLEQLVEERTAALQKSNEQLQQFAHIASHDLKEPVRKIKLFANKVMTEHISSLPPDAVFALQRIDGAANRMRTLIEDVLRYSLLQQAQLTTNPVDLNIIVQEVMDDLDVAIHEKKASLEIQSLPVVRGTPILFYQLFYNLLNNSLKFSRKDVLPVIKLWSESMGDRVEIHLSDNGIGFPQDKAHYIFEAFGRLHSKDAYEGTGLGLALCKQIVERHGGSIVATAEPMAGAKFTIVL